MQAELYLRLCSTVDRHETLTKPKIRNTTIILVSRFPPLRKAKDAALCWGPSTYLHHLLSAVFLDALVSISSAKKTKGRRKISRKKHNKQILIHSEVEKRQAEKNHLLRTMYFLHKDIIRHNHYYKMYMCDV